MTPQSRNALLIGLSDALCFVLGALAGWSLGSALGFDFVRATSYDARAIAGLLFILLGCGAGKWLALRWQTARGWRPPPPQR
ncbi:MAG TPA: hypothetical protein VLA16_13670 [Ideonella sp.]|nr:hypothetical protein [Ideonella sp.]